MYVNSSLNEDSALIPKTEVKSVVISPLEPALTSTIEIEYYVTVPLNEEPTLMSIESDVVSSLCEESFLMPLAKIETDSFSPESKELAFMSTIKTQSDVTSSLEKEPTLILGTKVQPAVLQPVIEETFSAPSIEDQVVTFTAEELAQKCRNPE